MRVATSALTGGVGTAMPAKTFGYDAATGLATTVAAAATPENPATTMTTGYDDFGRVTSYTDGSGAAANTATTSYDAAGRVAGLTDRHGSLTYSYNGGGEHRGLTTGMTVSGLTGGFSASYGPDGELVSQGLPNGVTQTLGRDEDGQLTNLSADAGTANGRPVPGPSWRGGAPHRVRRRGHRGSAGGDRRRRRTPGR